MSINLTCDRCDDTSLWDFVSGISFTEPLASKINSYNAHLCPSCTDAFVQFMKGEKKIEPSSDCGHCKVCGKVKKPPEIKDGSYWVEVHDEKGCRYEVLD